MAPVHVLRPMQRILQKEMVRECLAEFMSTYVMMVSERVVLGVCGGQLLTPWVIAFLPLPLSWELGKESEEEKPFSSSLFWDRRWLMIGQDRMESGWWMREEGKPIVRRLRGKAWWWGCVQCQRLGDRGRRIEGTLRLAQCT